MWRAPRLRVQVGPQQVLLLRAATPQPWSEPPLTVFDKPLVFDGKDGLRLTCHYMNTTDRDVHFGTGVADEMCFMWLYYYETP